MNCNNQTCPKKKECSSYNPRVSTQFIWIIDNGVFKCKGFFEVNEAPFIDFFNDIIRGKND